MSPRRSLLAAGVLVLAAASIASAVGSSPLLTAAQDYAAFHGTLGHQSLMATSPSYSAPGFGVTPAAACVKGNRPETDRMGRVPLRDYTSGRAAKGYTCNATDLGHEGDSGGFQVHRYVDKHGRECGYYDGTLLFPTKEPNKPGGVVVLDMSNPAKPKRTTVLNTLAMKTPHESFRLNTRRGLLAAVAGSPFTQAGVVDLYDASEDCRQPVLKSTSPLGILGHEGAFSPDGNTYWAATTADRGLTAIDVSDPAVPVVLYHGVDATHGLSISEDGTRAYLADVQSDRGVRQNYATEITNGGGGLRILDISQIQHRTPLAQVKEIGYVTWPEVTIPQSTIPVTIKGHRYVVEFDEYDSNVTAYSADENVGGVRIIDIANEKKPKVVSRIRLAVWEKKARASQAEDPGAASGTQGYAAHYCAVPQRAEPGILACSTIVSGLRVFDIRNPLRPRQVAYANHPAVDKADPAGSAAAAAMSAPAFVPQRREVWYTDANSGFWVERLTASAWPSPAKR